MASVGNLQQDFLNLLKDEFPSVRFKTLEMKTGKIRVSPYIPNGTRDKRWMQIDISAKILSIVMDHTYGDILQSDLPILSELSTVSLRKTRIQLNKNEDAVDLSVFKDEVIDFADGVFVSFLGKHFKSYLNRI